jgi:hypothetical protein
MERGLATPDTSRKAIREMVRIWLLPVNMRH